MESVFSLMSCMDIGIPGHTWWEMLFIEFKYSMILIDEQESKKLKYILYGELIVVDKCHLKDFYISF